MAKAYSAGLRYFRSQTPQARQRTWELISILREPSDFKFDLRCRSPENLRATCGRHQADAQGKRSRESRNHAKFDGIAAEEKESGDGAD